jgi:D-alanyl-D-alanine carboxypeptidase/D-alanyl-D-alanine-endopeptidase (penicillin-binding protein 4)
MSWAAALLLSCTFAASGEELRSLPDTVIRALNAGKIPPDRFSVFAQEIGRESPALAFNADVPRNPASTMKLVTTFVGLEVLSPTYVWKTQAFASRPPSGGVLDGDLYLKGFGDPFLVIERYWLLLRELRLQGVRDIRGDLVIDNTYFEVGPQDPGDFDGRPFNPYNLVPDALLVNFQAINFIFRPDPVHGRVEVLADPLPANMRVRNQLQLVDGPCGGARNRILFTTGTPPNDESVTFTGRFSRTCAEYRVARSFLRAPTYAYGLFKTLWQDSGGNLAGRLRVAAVPPGASLMVTSESPPLAEVIRSINKFSNNVMARHLLLTLGAERYGAPGTVEKGDRAVDEFLNRRGIVVPELRVDNGAGLSRASRISARGLVRILLAAEQSPYRPEFISSLGLAGLDGTVRRRFRDEDFAGHMHLKTGTLSGVHAIAGYIDSSSGRRFAVAILQNGPGWPDESQAAVLRWIYRQ